MACRNTFIPCVSKATSTVQSACKSLENPISSNFLVQSLRSISKWLSKIIANITSIKKYGNNGHLCWIPACNSHNVSPTHQSTQQAPTSNKSYANNSPTKATKTAYRSDRSTHRPTNNDLDLLHLSCALQIQSTQRYAPLTEFKRPFQIFVALEVQFCDCRKCCESCRCTCLELKKSRIAIHWCCACVCTGQSSYNDRLQSRLVNHLEK